MNKKVFLIVFVMVLLVLQFVGCTNAITLKLVFDDESSTTIELKNDVDKHILPTPVKEGHTFLGWETNSGIIENGIWSKSLSTNLTAIWSANTYSLTLDFNNGSKKIEIRDVVYGSRVYLPNAYLSGYYFEGWASPEYEIVKTGDWKIAKNITLKASWSKPVFTIVLDYNDGVTPDGEITVTYGTSITLPQMIIDDKHIEGWYTDDGVCVTSGVWEREPVGKLTARWTSYIPPYVVI